MEFILGKKRKIISNFNKKILKKFVNIEMPNEFILYYKKREDSKKDISYYYSQSKGIFLVILGRVFELQKNNLELFVRDIINLYSSCTDIVKRILDLDGDFITFIYSENNDYWQIYADRSGILPIYYTVDDGLMISSNASFLYKSKNDVRLESIYDFLCYGTQLGKYTWAEGVFLLQGGHWLECSQLQINEYVYYSFFYNQSENKNLIEKIYETYVKGIQKRINTVDELSDTWVFMSGGLDSRFLLAACNSINTGSVSCLCYGQECSEEVQIAKRASELHCNEFSYIEMCPRDFILSAEEYVDYTAGNDMVIQSGIINISRKIAKVHPRFMTGYAMDAILGGTFLNNEAINSNDRFSDFGEKNLKLLKMSVFTNDEFKDICKAGVYERFFLSKRGDFREIAEQYDEWKVQDIIQPFAVNNRAKRIVLQRELIPALYMDAEYPSLDRDFLEIASEIPAKERINHKFYRELFIKVAKDYCEIPYNNTTLPIIAPLELWKKGSDLESEKEKMFSEILHKTQGESGQYKHYYSDFNSWIRYDFSWKEFIEKYLFSKDTIITKRYFDKEKIRRLYVNNCLGIENNRSKLVYLVSLEIILRKFFV